MLISLAVEGSVAVLELLDGQALLSDDLAHDLLTCCGQVEEDPMVLAVVLSGPLPTQEAPSAAQGPAAPLGLSAGPAARAAETLARLSVPTLVALDGPVVGAGAELAIACDLRIASQTATFQFPHLDQGSIPSAGGTQRLPRIVGRAHALQLLLLGDAIGAEEAFRMGLVARVVPQGLALEEARRLAGAIAEKAPVAVRYLREAVHQGMDLTLNQGLRLEADLYFLLQTTADRMEGINAFLEKRRPDFRGQ